MIKIKKGLDLPIEGAPSTTVDARTVRQVAVLGVDYPGMKPTMEVREGDTVTLGQLLFTDKKTAGVRYTAPAAGTVSAIHRGAKRALLSVVIDVDDNGGAEDFGALDADAARGLEREALVDKLVASGLWTALRTRPFGKVPAIDSTPSAVFVTAMDTNPLAGDPQVVIDEHADAFALGVDLVAKLTDGPTYVCVAEGSSIAGGSADSVKVEAFAGPHPAGLPGTHIHHLHSVGVGSRTVWHLGYQDVIAIAKLVTTGTLWTDRVVALGGPVVDNPRLLRTRLGASLAELTAGEVGIDDPDDYRVISGSVLAGRGATTAVGYLGRYHDQVSVIAENEQRELLGYLAPGATRHSVFPVYLSKLFGKAEFTTTTHGSTRAMVPIGTYEAICPMDMLPTQLLRAILVNDVETAINLGALELDEEDVAIYTYACPGKYEFGPVLRDLLTMIEKEG